MEILTGACELEPVSTEISAFSLGVPGRSRAFAVLLASPFDRANSGLGQSVTPPPEFRAQGKLSLLHGVC
jgi:hypothetical protein